uniref:hypothetical protein n=1 Tax=Salmonella enterica TaxID=28901 RepID=UPI00398C323B
RVEGCASMRLRTHEPNGETKREVDQCRSALACGEDKEVQMRVRNAPCGAGGEDTVYGKA